MTRWLPVSVAILAFMLPFEVRKPLLSLPYMGITDLELIALVVASLGAVSAATGRLPVFPPARVFIPALVVACLPILSALSAPSHRGASLKFALRMLTGVGVCFATWACSARPEGPRDTRSSGVGGNEAAATSFLPGFVSALVAGAGLSAALGIWTCLDPDGTGWLVPLFREREFLVGNAVRLSGTFEYPNIAAGYLVLAFVLSLSRQMPGPLFPVRTGGGPSGGSTRARLGKIVWTSAQGVILTGLAMTLSRAGVVVALLALALAIALSFTREGGAGTVPIRTRLRACLSPFLPAVGVTACCTVGVLMFYPPFGLRFRSGEDAGWYRARYRALEAIDLSAGAVSSVRVEVTNTGSIPWTPGGRHPFRLSYHWYHADTGSAIPGPQARTELPGPVRPGETLTLRARVAAPTMAGAYVLGWDMVHEHAAWFSQKGSPVERVPCRVGPASGLPLAPGWAENPPDPGALEAESVSRRTLWHAGWRMFRAHPLLGVGPDNFRRLWGREFGMDRWDERIHANSLYVEVFATTGTLGGLAFFGFLATLVVRQVRALGRSAGDPSGFRMRSALVAFAATVATHGVVDYFLGFTPIYLLFWMVAGVSVAMSAEEG